MVNITLRETFKVEDAVEDPHDREKTWEWNELFFAIVDSLVLASRLSDVQKSLQTFFFHQIGKQENSKTDGGKRTLYDLNLPSTEFGMIINHFVTSDLMRISDGELFLTEQGKNRAKNR